MISVETLVVGLVVTLIVAIFDPFLPRPLGIRLWLIGLIAVGVIVPLRVVLTELRYRKSL